MDADILNQDHLPKDAQARQTQMKEIEVHVRPIAARSIHLPLRACNTPQSCEIYPVTVFCISLLQLCR
jgi:hypothetical protein